MSTKSWSEQSKCEKFQLINGNVTKLPGKDVTKNEYKVVTEFLVSCEELKSDKNFPALM